MKLLFDQNLSPRLVDFISDIFPNSTHTNKIGLGKADDLEVWEYAHQNDYLIVSKDADFENILLVKGFPPKVIYIRHGNCTTQFIEHLLRREQDSIKDMYNDPDTGILIII